MSTDLEAYTKISQLYKEIVDNLTTKQLPQLKLYLTNLGKKIVAGEDKFLSEFKDVKELLDSIKQAKGKLPIHYAVASGRIDTVRYLIDTLKIDYSVKDKQGNTPFFTAIEHKHLDLVKYFVEELGVSPFSTKEGEIGTLHIAANQNNVQMIKYFLEKGCNIEKVSIYGKPINWAVGSKSEQATKFLLEQGADANGDTTCPAPAPIILAVDFELEQIYQALLNAPKSANIKIKDPQGYSLLHLAAEKGNLKLVKELVQKGLEVNQQIQGKTPLALAFQNNKWEVVAYLRTLTKNFEQIEKKLKEEKQQRQSNEAAHPIDKAKADEIKNQGNKYFIETKYSQALQKYKQAISYDPENDAIHRNLAACYLNLKQYDKALIHCYQAKLADPKNVKNLYREAQAYIGLNNLIDASSSLWQCAMLEPQTPFFRQEFQKYVELAKQQYQQQK